jgi:hypothetical protein
LIFLDKDIFHILVINNRLNSQRRRDRGNDKLRRGLILRLIILRLILIRVIIVEGVLVRSGTGTDLEMDPKESDTHLFQTPDQSGPS